MRAWVVVDLGCGDQGKGTITDFLVRDQGARLVVRYNGGAQAGHNVVTPDGRHHGFAQLGSGSFVPGVETWLSRFVAVQPWALVVEAAHLARKGVPDALARLTIAAEATVITPFHRAINRLRERARGEGRHGSCGVGVGEAVLERRVLPEEEVLRAGDLRASGGLRGRLARIGARLDGTARALAERCDPDDPTVLEDLAVFGDPALLDVWVDQLAPLRDVRVVPDAALGEALRRAGTVVMEGAHGVLLDEEAGFAPHITPSRCTDAQAVTLLEGFPGERVHLGVLRTYATRHGAGPLPTEDGTLAHRLPEPHNAAHPWQGPFRVGHLDAVTARHAIAACARIDGIALTCVDRVPRPRVATAYTIDGERVERLAGPGAAWTARLGRARPILRDAAPAVEVVTETVGRVRIRSWGPTAGEKGWV